MGIHVSPGRWHGLAAFSALTTPDRATPPGPFRRAEIYLRMDIADLVRAAGKDIHHGPGSALLRVFQKSYPDDYGRELKKYGPHQVIQPVSKHRQDAAWQYAEGLYLLAPEAVYESRQWHVEHAAAIGKGTADDVAGFLQSMFIKIRVRPQLSNAQKEALVTDLRNIYNQAFGSWHQHSSRALAKHVMQSLAPLAQTELRRDFILQDHPDDTTGSISITVSDRALTTATTVAKVINRLYPEKTTSAERQKEKEWRNLAAYQASIMHTLTQEDMRFCPLSSSTQCLIEHHRGGGGHDLVIERRNVAFQKSNRITSHKVAPIDAGTLIITERTMVETEEIWNSMQPGLVKFARVMKSVLEDEELLKELFLSPDREALFAAMSELL